MRRLPALEVRESVDVTSRHYSRIASGYGNVF
jgi:hypothetical protein